MFYIEIAYQLFQFIAQAKLVNFTIVASFLWNKLISIPEAIIKLSNNFITRILAEDAILKVSSCVQILCMITIVT